MRLLFFRGKDIKTGKWIYGSALPHDGDKCVIAYQSPADGSLESYDVEPETVGQYTGLRDKNGQMIFEGDIIRYCNENFYIEYVEGFASFTAREGRNMSYAPSLTPITAERIEVVGNIHDNPELLEARA